MFLIYERFVGMFATTELEDVEEFEGDIEIISSTMSMSRDLIGEAMLVVKTRAILRKFSRRAMSI